MRRSEPENRARMPCKTLVGRSVGRKARVVPRSRPLGVSAGKALYYRGSEGGLEWRDDPAPTILAPSDALVRPLAASTCDLDQAIVHSTVPGAEQPFAIGHEAVGEPRLITEAPRTTAAA